MRISDERYRRDLRKLELAGRMLTLEARTRTVERWTTLSMNRIRAMYHAYEVVDTPRLVPRRGVTPTCVNFFWKSAVVRCDAAMLGGFLRQFDVWPEGSGDAAASALPNLARGERLCLAIEQFKGLRPTSEFKLEQGLMLLTELVRGVEIQLARCPECEGLVLLDRLAIGRKLCAFCVYERFAGMPDGVAKEVAGVGAAESADPAPDSGVGQHSFF